MRNEQWLKEGRTTTTEKKNHSLFFVEAFCARVTRLIEFIIRRIVEPNGIIINNKLAFEVAKMGRRRTSN